MTQNTNLKKKVHNYGIGIFNIYIYIFKSVNIKFEF